MPNPRGVSLLDLLALPPGSQNLIPSDIRTELDKLSVLEYHSSTSPDAHIYFGTVRSLGDAFFASSLNWPIELPGLNVGVPFQLTRRRRPPDTGAGENLEPAPDNFQIDLFLDRVSIVVPGLRPAKFVDSSGITAAHLVVDSSKKNVRIAGTGTIRIASNPGGGAPVLRFISFPDPLDPGAPTGAVFTIGFDPPHFFLGGSDFGMTVDRLTYDDSEVFTPPEIIARGQAPSWRGISIKEATVYFPRNAPVVGDVSAGVRDVLLGTPLGLQGEIRIEFGKTPVDPATVSFFQMLSSGESPLGGASGTGRSRTVQIAAGISTAQVRAQGSGGSTARWRLPDGRVMVAQGTPYFTISPGDTLTAEALETDSEGHPVASPATSFRFVEATPPGAVPTIDAVVGVTTRANVAHLSGPPALLAGITFASNPATSVRWQLGTGPAAPTATGATFAPAFPGQAGVYDLTLTDGNNHVRRLRVQVLTEGDLIVGAAAGVFDQSGSVNVRAVEATDDLLSFQNQGQLVPGSPDATLAGAAVTVAPGTLAAVTVERGTAADPGGTPPPVPPPEPTRHLQVLMDFDTDHELTWGGEALPDPFSIQKLREWAASFTGADFVIIGRTCDIGTKARNKEVCQLRAQRGKTLLTDSGLAGPAQSGSAVHARGEQHTWVAAGDSAGLALEAGLGLPADETEAQVAVGPDNGWLFRIRFGTFSDTTPDTHGRPAYRRIDIYAVGGTAGGSTPTTPAEEQARDPSLRRTLVPGADAAAIVPATPRDRATPYRVRLVVRWDSPTVIQLSDAIPTQAELTIAWQADNQQLPGAGAGNTVAPHLTNPGGGGPEIFTFIGTWAYDPRSGQTQFTLALNSAGDPNGLAYIGSTPATTAENIFAVAMGLGPALMAGISTADVSGAAARIGALIAASTAAAFFARDGKLVLFGIKLEWRQKALDSLEGSRQRLLFDYTAQIGFDINAFGIHVTADKPIKIRYKDVGVELDNSKSGLDKFGLVYENVSFDIEDPGQWTINGPLGEMLRVAGTRAGSGSTWIEVDLKFALDLGVIRITGCTLRVDFPTGGGLPGIEFRGFSAAVNIPGTLEGSGMLSIGDGGAIRAGIDMNVIPAKVLARGSLAIQGDFTAIEVILILPVGLPLASSGLGLYGFAGRFVANGARLLPAGTTDPIQKEIDWYRTPAPNKYGPMKGQWALGLGAVIGTMPDTGFTFNALGMFTISFPDVSVVFSIDAGIFKLPALPREDGLPPAAGLNLLGIIAIDSTAVKVAVRGSYVIPHVLDLQVPFGGYFPLPGGPGDTYVRVGADGFEGRTGDKVTLRLLPDSVDLRVWAYLMVEARQLHRLGGNNDFNFDGFSIGFGAGFSIQWGGGPIFLRASAMMLIGVGTKPMMIMGGIFIRGELRLIIVSVSLSGDITAIITNDQQRLHGKFCGEVDFFFFSVKGCVEIEVGSGPAPSIPVPDHPLLRVDLTDRKGAITGRAPRDGAPADPNAPPSTVWPDTVPLLSFSSYIQNRLAGSPFSPTPAELPGPQWSGSSGLKYAYRLIGIDLIKVGSGAVAGPLESVWWWPTHRGGVLNPADPPPSDNEGRMLALLSWFPAPWSRNISDGGDGTPGDPADTVGDLCTPTQFPVHNCALGQNAERTALDQVKLRPDGPSAGPLPNYFVVNGRERGPSGLTYTDYLQALTLLGYHIVPGHLESLGGTLPPAAGLGANVTGAFEIPYAARQASFISTLDFVGTYSPAVNDPTLTLAICRRGNERPPKAEKVCDDYADIKPGTVLEPKFQRNGLTYKWVVPPPPNQSPAVDFFPKGAPDESAELWLGQRGLMILLPSEVSSVELDVAYFFGEPIKAAAFADEGGPVLAEAQSPDIPNVRHTLQLNAPGIRMVWIDGGHAVDANRVSPRTAGVLMRFCYSRDRVTLPDGADLFPVANSDLPVVIGTRADGTVVPWVPKPLPIAAGNTRCKLFTYFAPDTGPWLSFEILPWQRTHLEILGTCGIQWEWFLIATSDQQTKNDTISLINLHALLGAKEKKNLLVANAEYEIHVRCQWRGWELTDSQPSPPPLDDSGWTDFPEVVHRFHTAPELALPANPPPFEFKDETTFDPRGVNRYLIGFRPDGTGAPHFLDDPLAVDFTVDHLEQLVNLYARDFKLKLRRTDPPPASLPGFTVPPDLLLSLVWKDLPLMIKAVADQRFIQAAIDAPCVDPPNLGGSTAEIQADMERNAEYDLLLVAPPSGTSVDRVLVTRSHFRTSHYRNPAELLAALGFRSPVPYPILPVDAFVTGVAGISGTIKGNDQDFETALKTLGLDPWPLPDQPRTVALWIKSGGAYLLAGLLIEADEPLERGTRLSVVGATVGPSTLDLRRSNAAGTRVLLLPSASIGLPGDTTITLTLNQPGGPISGTRNLSKGPRILAQEGL